MSNALKAMSVFGFTHCLLLSTHCYFLNPQLQAPSHLYAPYQTRYEV